MGVELQAGTLVFMTPAYDLSRFIQAQSAVFSNALRELRAGRKTTHWMWFVFPQLKALGRSETARFYGLSDGAEAAAYFRHPVLGGCLLECARLLLAIREHSAHDIFGSPDDRKLRSCMTLFGTVAPDEQVFREVLERFYAGQPDAATLRLLQ